MTASLRDIRLFVAAYEERSFTAAAGRENATQSGVSQHVAKLEQQKAINTVIRELGNVGGAATGGLVTFTPAQVKTLQDAGFAFPDAAHTRADGAIQRNPDDGTYFVPAGKLDTAKKELTEFVTTLSSTNEIEMLSIQRLMNQANEASQAASALLKSGHDVAMSIIRNIA